MLSAMEIQALAGCINEEYAAVHMAVRVQPGVNGVVQTPTGIYFRLQLGTHRKRDRAGNMIPTKRATVTEAQTARMLTQLENSLGTRYREYMTGAPRKLRNVPERLVSFIASPACIVLPYLEDVPLSMWQPEYAGSKRDREITIGFTFTPTGQFGVVWDRATNSHFLIAGTTNSGKTSALAQITASFLWLYSPEELELVLIDPKNSMARVFGTMPHCRLPVAVRPSEFDRAVYALDSEMERRVKHSITEPHLLVVIDELTDVVERSRENQDHLFNVARKGREFGITLLLGIHKPLTDIMGQAASQFAQRMVFRMRTPQELNAASGATGLSPFRLTRPGVCYALDQYGTRLAQSFMLGKSSVAAIKQRWQTAKQESVLMPALRALDDMDAGVSAPQLQPAMDASEVLLSVGSTDKATYGQNYVNTMPVSVTRGPVQAGRERPSINAAVQAKQEARENFRKLCNAFGVDKMYSDKLPSYRQMLLALGLPDGGPQYAKNRETLDAALAQIGIDREAADTLEAGGDD